MYKYRVLCTVLALVLFAGSIIAVSMHGQANRIYASSKTTHQVDSPQKAYYIWKDKKVRGRTLILFDNYPHSIGYYAYKCLPELNKTNLIEFSVFQNIIRRIYLVVPEMEWSEFRNQKFVRQIREASELTKGVYLYNQSGIFFIAVTPSSLPQIKEEALVYINNHVIITI